MKRRIYVLFIAAFCAAAMAGCKKNVGTPEDNAVVEETEEKKNEKGTDAEWFFGISCPELSNPFYETIKDSIQMAVEEQGGRTLIKDPENDADMQNAQILNMIEEGVDAVFLCPADWEKITPALEALDEADIPVVNVDIRVKETDLTDAFVASDNRNAGYVCGEDLLQRKPDGGTLVIAENPGVNSVNERITGFEEAIVNTGFEVAARISAAAGSNVKAAMEQILAENEHIDAVMCGNDRMAMDVLSAIKEAGRTDALVYSVDGSPDVKKELVISGSPMAGIGAQSPISIGKTAAEVGLAILNGENYEKESYEETFFINRENVEMYGTDGWQ